MVGLTQWLRRATPERVVAVLVDPPLGLDFMALTTDHYLHRSCSEHEGSVFLRGGEICIEHDAQRRVFTPSGCGSMIEQVDRHLAEMDTWLRWVHAVPAGDSGGSAMVL